MFNPVAFFPFFRTSLGSVQGVANTPVQVVPADPFRVYLAVYNHSNVDVTLSTDPNVGPQVSPWTLKGNSGFEFFWERHGVIVTSAFFCNNPSGTPAIAWATMGWQPH